MNDGDKRRRWKWVVPLVLFLGVVGTYLGWGGYQQGKMNRQVEAYRAKGEPVWVEDFNRPTGVGDEENAALDLREAARLIDQKREEWNAVEALWAYVPVPAEEAAGLRALVDAYPGVIERVGAAMRKGRVDWQVQYNSPLGLTPKLHMTEQRSLARFLVAAAFEAHARGDEATAVRRLREALRVGWALGEDYGVIEHLVSVGIVTNASVAAAEIAKELDVEKAGRDEVRALLADLGDEAAYRAGMKRAMIGNRAEGLDALLTFGGTGAATGTPRRVLWLVAQPLAWSSARPMMRRATVEAEAATREDWPAARAAMPTAPAGRPITPHAVMANMIAASPEIMRTHFLGLAIRRLAAVAVAVRWYAAEHGGALPPDLGALVPEYLPSAAALRDPMAGGEALLRYVRRGDSTVVYSLGRNGTDEGGSEKVRFEMNGPDPADMEDAVIHLTPRPRPIRPAGEY